MALFIILVWNITGELFLNNSSFTGIFDHIILFGWYFPQKNLLRGFENSLSLICEKEILKWGESSSTLQPVSSESTSFWAFICNHLWHLRKSWINSSSQHCVQQRAHNFPVIYLNYYKNKWTKLNYIVDKWEKGLVVFNFNTPPKCQIYYLITFSAVLKKQEGE